MEKIVLVNMPIELIEYSRKNTKIKKDYYQKLTRKNQKMVY